MAHWLAEMLMVAISTITSNPNAFEARFFSPTKVHVLKSGQCLDLKVKSNLNATLTVYDNGNVIATDTNTTSLDYCQSPGGQYGNHILTLMAFRAGIFVEILFTMCTQEI